MPFAVTSSFKHALHRFVSKRLNRYISSEIVKCLLNRNAACLISSKTKMSNSCLDIYDHGIAKWAIHQNSGRQDCRCLHQHVAPYGCMDKCVANRTEYPLRQ